MLCELVPPVVLELVVHVGVHAHVDEEQEGGEDLMPLRIVLWRELHLDEQRDGGPEGDEEDENERREREDVDDDAAARRHGGGERERREGDVRRGCEKGM